MQPYTINIGDNELADLKKRLDLARFPDELEDAGWTYGAPLADIKRLTEYWRSRYDWKKTEARLNQLSNFTTNITAEGFDPVKMHFVHQRSSAKDSIPLLFCHGWPGSYVEVEKLLPLLSDASGTASFHIVAPSLPNYAWSGSVKKRNFGLAQYAETCHKLMIQLGYSRYATQGGDWGFYVTRAMGLLYPESCLVSHINMVRASQPSWTTHPLLALAHSTTGYTDFEKAGRERSQWFLEEGSGYRAIQSTKPQTPGYGITDSPVGLLAWIYEKLHDWTDAYPWTDDEVLDWVNIYWFSTAGPAASFRIYYEATHEPPVGTSSLPYVGRDRAQQYIPHVKLALCYSPKELTVVPKTWGRTLGDIVYESEQGKGGHFLAHERPEAIAHDLKTMFGLGGAVSHMKTQFTEDS